MRRRVLVVLGIVALTFVSAPMAAADAPAYRSNDYGNVLNVLPPGSAGNANAVQAAPWLPVPGNPLPKTYPPHFNDQFGMYQDLLYGYGGLQDSGLSSFYKDASFGVQPQDIERVYSPANAPGALTILRDKSFGVPHVYGDSTTSMAYGAGYATAEDRLFMIDVLRHYGRGHLSELVGPSCGNEQMDHDQLQLTGYTQQDKDNQLAYIDTLGPIGHEGRQMIHAYVAGINQYITEALLDPNKMPVEYPVATLGPPGLWQDSDIIDIASLVGGIFGKGGGNEVASGNLLKFLQQKFPGNGGQDAYQMFKDFHAVNDPNAPVVTPKSFPYDLQTNASAKNAFTDPAAAVSDPSTTTVSGCAGIASFLQNFQLPSVMSNALVVDAKHSASGRPIAVFGPQVGYFAPEILQEVDLHAPDYDARGASFPGTSFLVELGRGQDYAWSATSAGTDIVDQRLEIMCPTPSTDTDPKAKYYMLSGSCVKMDYHDDSETTLPKPGGLGVPPVPSLTIHHDIYRTNPADPIQAIVLGFTKAATGQSVPAGADVAIVTQRSTYQHELDSSMGFLRWQHPSMTHDAKSWMVGAQQIGYTFNWFYVDNKDIAYFVSGNNPVRPTDYDRTLPTWGDGRSQWQGFQASSGHPQAINPAQGFLSSWNNKPAPSFGAADDQYGYGPVFRQQTLVDNIKQQFALHNNKITRANLVQAMEGAASVDLSAARVGPELLKYLAATGAGSGLSANEQKMLTDLGNWIASGSHRVRAQHGDALYAYPPGPAIMDELEPHLVMALFNSVFCADPNNCTAAEVNTTNGLASSYAKHPMGWTDLPSGRLGSSYDGGWEGYLLKALRQLRRQAGDTTDPAMAQPLSTAMLSGLCGTGASGCRAAIVKAIHDTYAADSAANSGAANPDTWTISENQAYCASHGCATQMPAYDNITLRAIGLVTEPDLDWQNRPTFQQVVDFPSHRPRLNQAALVSVVEGSGDVGAAAALFLFGLVAVGMLARRRRPRAGS
jgi:acyl-homoserine lactone acylase PvdQ